MNKGMKNLHAVFPNGGGKGNGNFREGEVGCAVRTVKR